MKRLFRWAFRLVILLLVLTVAGLLLLDTIARDLLAYRIHQKTGLETKIGKLDVGIFDPHITMENFVVYNSAEFGGSPLIDMPELHVEYDRHALFSREWKFRLFRIKIAEVNIVEDTKGRLNLEALRKQLEKTGGGGGTNANKGSNGFQFRGIDTLNNTLWGRVNFLSMTNPARVDSLRLTIKNQIFTNIQSAQELGQIATPEWTYILLCNGVNLSEVMSKDHVNTNSRWSYWNERLKQMGKK